MKDIKNLLRLQPFFDELSDEMIEYIAGCGVNKHFGPGDFLCREGEAADEFYVIRKGRIAVLLHHPIQGDLIIKTLKPGQMGGFSWIIPPYIMQFDLKALEHTSVVALDGKCLRKKCEEDYKLGYYLMKRSAVEMNDRLIHSRIQLLDVYSSRI